MHCASLRVLCNAIYGWTIHRRKTATVQCRGRGHGCRCCCSDTLWWAVHNTARRARGHAGTVGAAGAGGRHERANERQWALGVGHSHRTQTAPAWGFGKGRGRCARESFKRQQGCSCVESGGPTRKCRVSAAHTGGCCFLLSGYPTSPVCRSMVHCTQSACSAEVIYILYVAPVLYEAMAWCRYAVHGTRYKHAPSWAEQPERTPRLGPSEKAKLPLSLAAQVDTPSMGSGNGTGTASMELGDW